MVPLNLDVCCFRTPPEAMVVGRELAEIGDEIDGKYGDRFKRMSRQLGPFTYDKFQVVCRQYVNLKLSFHCLTL